MPLHSQSVPAAHIRPAGCLGESFDRQANAAIVFAMPAGQMRMTAVPLDAGTAVSITALSAGTVPSAITHLWAALYDKDLNLLGQSPDDTAPVWVETTLRTFTFTAPIALPYTGLYYVGICETGTTRHGLQSLAVASIAAANPPAITGTSTVTGLTTTAPASAGTVSGTTSIAYVYVS